MVSEPAGVSQGAWPPAQLHHLQSRLYGSMRLPPEAEKRPPEARTLEQRMKSAESALVEQEAWQASITKPRGCIQVGDLHCRWISDPSSPPRFSAL